MNSATVVGGFQPLELFLPTLGMSRAHPRSLWLTFLNHWNPFLCFFVLFVAINHSRPFAVIKRGIS